MISNEIRDKIVELSTKAITDQLSHQAKEQVAENFCRPRCGGTPDGKLCPDAERIRRLFVALLFELYSRSN